MRGTLVGNEDTRWAGIKEMREAKALREYYRKHPERRTKGRHGGGLFSFLGLGGSKSHKSRSSASKSKQASRSSSTRAVVRREPSSRSHSKGGEVVLHVSHHSRSPHRNHSSRVEGRITGSRASSGSKPPRPPPQRRATTGGERAGKPRPPPQRRGTDGGAVARRR